MPPASIAAQIIATLGLEALPGEGGFFRVTWRSPTASAIFFLITRADFSALHRLAQDEMWHFYAGDPVTQVQLDPRDGAVRVAEMGPDVLAGQQPQVHVPAGVWQGAALAEGNSAGGALRRSASAAATPASRVLCGYALLGCTVSPPWDERGFALGERAALVAAFPEHAARILALTR